MCPSFMKINHADKRLADAKAIGNLNLRHLIFVGKLTNLSNGIIGQFGRSVIFSALNNEFAMSDLISYVFGICSPRKIYEAIIKRVTVKMAGALSIWTQTYESFKHKAMNIIIPIIVSTKVNTGIFRSTDISRAYGLGQLASGRKYVAIFCNSIVWMIRNSFHVFIITEEYT